MLSAELIRIRKDSASHRLFFLAGGSKQSFLFKYYFCNSQHLFRKELKNIATKRSYVLEQIADFSILQLKKYRELIDIAHAVPLVLPFSILYGLSHLLLPSSRLSVMQIPPDSREFRQTTSSGETQPESTPLPDHV